MYPSSLAVAVIVRQLAAVQILEGVICVILAVALGLSTTQHAILEAKAVAVVQQVTVATISSLSLQESKGKKI